MTQTVVYVSCAESREILVFSLDTHSGEIQLRQSLATTEGQPQPLRISPNRRILYAGTRSDSAVLALSIDPASGELAWLGSQPAPGNSTYVSCDRAMRVAFSASYGGNSLSVFPLDEQGALRAASQTEDGLPRAHAALIDGSNRWLLVPTLGADAIRVYRLENDGHLTPNNPAQIQVRPGSGPRHPRFSADNRHIHCLNELDGSIDLFDFDASSGTLTPKQSVSMLPPNFEGKPWAAEIRATPDGRFLYATDRTASTIAAFAVDLQTGAITLIDHYPTEAQPRGMGIDPSGRWLIAAGQLSARLTVYAIDPDTGRLTSAHTHSTGLDPICVEIVSLPNGQPR
ncbi:MAG: beta-propeller fold lactonase family protein [Formivibrio sp.]|nr:beta-propeller fold lactonase family protein [Formivibrio sp.]